MSNIPPQLDVGQLTIPLFIGTIINWALLGVLAVQVYIYLAAFPKDRSINKLVVAFIAVAEILQTAGDSRNTIETFGSRWGDINSLDEVLWAWFSVPILGSTIASVGQLFFAWRISIISGGTWIMPAVIAVITVFQMGAGIWTGVDIILAKRFSQLTFDQLRPPIAWLSATAACDLIIVAATLYYIMKSRQPGLHQVTKTSVSRIIKVSVETGVLCAVFALVDLYLFVKYDGNNYHLASCIWLSKVYSNSILVILNSRAYIGHDVPPNASRAHMTDMVFQSQNWAGAPIHVSMMSPSHIDTDAHSHSDASSHTQHDHDPHDLLALDKLRGEMAV
ncbi:hypothetical protein C8R46DRAFT_1008285 [Mycena filopes]|nr:hypothetical protein C8R46DRAFT_1008285 [Mycena filopes]